MPEWEPAADRGLWALSDPRLSNPSQDEEECCYGQKNLGQYSILSLSPTHLAHTRNITLSRIKCEWYIFIKKCIHSFIEVRILCLIMFLLIFVLRFGAVTRILDQSMVLLWFWDSSRNCRGPYCVWEDERCICIVLWCTHVRIATCAKNSMK